MSANKLYFGVLTLCLTVLIGCAQEPKSAVNTAEMSALTQAPNPVQRLAVRQNTFPAAQDSGPKTMLNPSEGGLSGENAVFGPSAPIAQGAVDPLGNGLPPWYCTGRYWNHNIRECQNYPLLPTVRNTPWPDPLLAPFYYYGLGYDGYGGFSYDDYEYGYDRDYRHKHRRDYDHIHHRRDHKKHDRAHRDSHRRNVKKPRLTTKK